MGSVKEERYVSESSAEVVASAASVVVAASATGAAGSWRRATGIAGAAIGVIAAGAAAGVALERMTVGRGMRAKARLALDSTGPYGALRGTPGKAYADDGTELYYEVDDVEPQGGPANRRRRLFGRKAPLPVTVVFSHGYCLSQDSWHFQRAALRGSYGPCTGTSAATAGPGAATPRCRTACRSPSTSWGAI